MANGLLGDPTALRGLLQSPSTTDFALAMLANSGYSNRRRSLGEIVGASMLQSRQMAAEQAQQKLREQYMQAQIQAMQAKPQAQQRSPFNLGDPTTYTRESVAEFQQTGDYSVLEPIPAAPVEKQFPLGAGGMLVDAEGNVLVRNPSRGQGGVSGTGETGGGLRPPKPTPLMRGVEINPATGKREQYVRMSDGSIVWGGIEQTPDASPADKPPTEGERVSANYWQRMQSAEQKLGAFKPSAQDYIAFMNMMAGGGAAGGVRGAIANQFLSPEGRQYYQAASDWVRAKLRKESGAVIADEEMAAEIKTYFPLPGDDEGTVAQKQQAREQAITGMRGMAGRAAGNGGATGQPRTFASEAEAAAAARRGEIKAGDPIVVNGRKARWQ